MPMSSLPNMPIMQMTGCVTSMQPMMQNMQPMMQNMQPMMQNMQPMMQRMMQQPMMMMQMGDMGDMHSSKHFGQSVRRFLASGQTLLVIFMLRQLSHTLGFRCEWARYLHSCIRNSMAGAKKKEVDLLFLEYVEKMHRCMVSYTSDPFYPMLMLPGLITPSKKGRLTVYPIEYPDVWRHYKRQLASFWTAEEVDFSKDREQWDTLLSDAERKFVRSILAFFAASDSVVSLNIMNNFCKEVTILEAQICYTFQAMMENIHAEVYSIMIDVYVTDPTERDQILNDVGTIPSVKRKVDWSEQWSLSDAPLSRRLLAYAVVEGVFFSGAFCAIYWLKQRNLLPGLTKSNEFIARDEGMHTDFAVCMYKLLGSPLTTTEAHAIFKDAVAIETEFITESIPCHMVGMNAELMASYIRFVADALLLRLGHPILFGDSNPFDFMELMGMVGRSNFFEERVSHYQRADVLNEDQVGTAQIYDPDF
ncbi:hypothetical protein CEUSTIGMA_g13093.t1 [Chlamydomonas eustigma]|uniref:Uncharacterized protein n=1 Tax=Chlamydomonas eustigma TaxID=1157962 RepID=A0A250XRW2_9CHLO|nr:hypothetical protein CEUSTIGMA_g13093.t1 [Chlamydomonas eustigma]|eukprot:GAX85679.1 hypothetical protein CEUSTIGMA_g13093.t1 [Chlamydomonas eustigma]